MKISVVIPTRNRIADLRECLDTLHTQTLPPDEVVIVDNSTNDETEQYIKDWKNSASFQCIYIRQADGGTSSLRNTGIDSSNGDTVFFLDDDVVLDKEYIAVIMEILANDTSNEIGGITGLGGFDIGNIGSFGLEIPVELKDTIYANDALNQRLQELVLERYGRDVFKHSTGHHFIHKIAKLARNAATTFFLMESPRKGKVLSSGFRSAFPPIPHSVPFVSISSLPGYNMCFRREVLNEFKFDKNLELFPYALCEDHELSINVGEKYKLVATSKARLIHKRSPGARIDTRGLFVAIVVNHHYIVKKNLNHPANILAFWWAVLGILIGSIVTFILHPSRERWLRLAGTIDGMRICIRRKT